MIRILKVLWVVAIALFWYIVIAANYALTPFYNALIAFGAMYIIGQILFLWGKYKMPSKEDNKKTNQSDITKGGRDIMLEDFREIYDKESREFYGSALEEVILDSIVFRAFVYEVCKAICTKCGKKTAQPSG